MAKPPSTHPLPARRLVEFEGASDRTLIAFAVGPDRAVYALHALGAYTPGRPPPAYRVRAWLDGQCLLDTRIDDEPHMLYALQPLGADLLLLSVPPGKSVGAANGRVYSREGRRLRELILGHGIEHLQTTLKGAIWTAYFDEGVFGDDPVSAHGLAAWDALGESTYRFHPDLAGLDHICDCYALNVADDRETWAYYYTQFPLVLLRDRRILRYWNVPIAGAHAFAVRREHALFTGGYEQRDTLTLLRLGENAHCDPLARFRPCDEDGEALSADRFHGRADALYFHAAGGIWAVGLDEALAAAS
jgi:hypothetical protein